MLSFESPTVDFCRASEDEIISYCETTPAFSESPGVKRLSNDVLAKVGFGISDHEYWNQRHAWQKVNGSALRIPEPFRYFKQKKDDGVESGYLLMEYIPGGTLEDDSRAMDHAVIEKVVKAIHFMHKRTCNPGHKPGPVSGGLAQGFPWGQRGAEREFKTITDLEHCANRRLLADSKPRKALNLQNQVCALVHGDLVPRNIIVDDHGNIAILDWATAAYYPPIFEVAALYVGMGLAAPEQKGFFDTMVARLKDVVHGSEEDVKKLERVQIRSISRHFLNEKAC